MVVNTLFFKVRFGLLKINELRVALKKGLWGRNDCHTNKTAPLVLFGHPAEYLRLMGPFWVYSQHLVPRLVFTFIILLFAKISKKVHFGGFCPIIGNNAQFSLYYDG